MAILLRRSQLRVRALIGDGPSFISSHIQQCLPQPSPSISILILILILIPSSLSSQLKHFHRPEAYRRARLDGRGHLGLDRVLCTMAERLGQLRPNLCFDILISICSSFGSQAFEYGAGRPTAAQGILWTSQPLPHSI